jgi:hypothetical protein
MEQMSDIDEESQELIFTVEKDGEIQSIYDKYQKARLEAFRVGGVLKKFQRTSSSDRPQTTVPS